MPAADDQDALKQAAARRALELVKPGMVIGIGTGTTARYFIEGLAGIDVHVLPTSVVSAELARRAGLTVLNDAAEAVDLAVDGADEIDPELRLVKGHGGALFREKMVATSARRFVVIADDSKLVDHVGRGIVPVEVAPFMWRQTLKRLSATGAHCELRGGSANPYVTDNRNLIADLQYPERLVDPEGMASALKAVTGVLEHGLFIGLAHAAIVAGADGIKLLGTL